ncbi:MAG: hypothetical protein COU42_00745 [Candidatus Nealsonbacteria bacterium CG10_big_fil_rev_8_21_14_0_10_36_24]|uniref:Portal protein n=1 Tax=Candidatus Nealsonbacteria bacterium CG10_big_fil_rev_8_21_14_0_10_36_24 TaxID=1974710 RepID=A0A2M6NSH0_9BACT|nr:MAG: hypothetical protein COU42_00745 [Candidatus Nealsonbacteria bacterium CG10_big_fil_rev_8_21_14_0_10_36_24]
MDQATLITKLNTNKDAAFKFQQRRHSDWNENYTLYRDKVIINRLTQRQSVNIPLIKETLRTILAQTDDAPDLFFEELSNDKQKEIFLNEYFLKNAQDNKLEIKDIVDKKQEYLYGRTFKKLNVVDGAPYVEILDPYDILVDRYADPADLDTAQFIIHQHIFRILREIENNPLYDQGAITKLKIFYATEGGLIKSGENAQSLAEKNQRMETMGDVDITNPLLGEVYVELNEHYIKLWDEAKKKFEIHLVTTCSGAGTEILLDKPLEEIIGKTKDDYWQNHYPILSWADDVERSDIWSDGVADIVRTPNKILNAWFSQLVENRTLRNFGMNYYDSTLKGFVPPTFEPKPFGWYPLPGKPNEVFQKVDIPNLLESLDEMTFLIQLVEKAVGATANEKGVSEKKQITLGEVQIMLGKAMERMNEIAKFYKLSWKEFGEKWVKLVEAQNDNLQSVKLYKKSFKGNYFEKEISPNDWKSEVGYKVKVISSAEQEQETIQVIQKLNAIIAQMPNNSPLLEIYHKKLLDLGGLNADEMREVLDYEKQKQSMPQMPQVPVATPAQASIPAQIPAQNKQLIPQNV